MTPEFKKTLQLRIAFMLLSVVLGVVVCIVLLTRREFVLAGICLLASAIMFVTTLRLYKEVQKILK